MYSGFFLMPKLRKDLNIENHEKKQHSTIIVLNQVQTPKI